MLETEIISIQSLLQIPQRSHPLQLCLVTVLGLRAPDFLMRNFPNAWARTAAQPWQFGSVLFLFSRFCAVLQSFLFWKRYCVFLDLALFGSQTSSQKGKVTRKEWQGSLYPWTDGTGCLARATGWKPSQGVKKQINSERENVPQARVSGRIAICIQQNSHLLWVKSPFNMRGAVAYWVSLLSSSQSYNAPVTKNTGSASGLQKQRQWGATGGGWTWNFG